MQSQGDRVVNQEVTGADGQEQGVVATVDAFEPARQPDVAVIGPGSRRNAIGVRQQDIEAVEGLTMCRLNELGEHRFDENLLLGGSEGLHDVVVDVQA